MPPLFADLESRGLVFQHTGVEEALAGDPLTAYIGFDPTADSLHVGHLLPVTILMRLQRAGHRPIALVGGGTGLVGDPSGKERERPMLDEDTLAANVAGLRAQLGRFLDFEGPAAARLVDNAEWLTRTPLTAFLRDVGKHFSVNAMLARDSVRKRIEDREQGISYTEFSYMLLQAYDFLELFDRFGCTLQCGGSDQWGNIVSGCDLVRRRRGAAVHGLTVPLVTRADGRKFGKSEAGNLWLDPDRTSPFEFFQYFLNLADADVGPLLRQFTFLPVEEIIALEAAHRADPGAREGQRRLATEMTHLVHGAPGVQRARRATEVLFGGGDLRGFEAQALRDAFAGSPTLTLSRDRLHAGDLRIVELLVTTGLSPSNGLARKQIREGAITLNHARVPDGDAPVAEPDLLDGGFLVLRRGKKSYHLVHFS